MARTSEDIFKRDSDMLKRMLAESADLCLEKLPLDRLFIEGYNMSLNDASDKEIQMPDESEI